MATEPSSRTAMIVAVIGAVGVVGAAWIARPGPEKATPPIQVVVNQTQVQAQLQTQAQVQAQPAAVAERPPAVAVDAPTIARPPTIRSPKCTPAPSGLVAWWDADHDGGERTSRFAANGPISAVPGAVGDAFAFTASAVLEVPPAPALTPSRGMTVEAWVRVEGRQVDYARLVGVQLDDSPQSNWVLGVGTRAGVYFGVFSSGRQTFIDGSARIPVGEWTHLAATWDGSTVRTYVNGLADGAAAAFSGPLDQNPLPLRLGGGNGPGRRFRGQLDEVALYDRALSADELMAIVAAGALGKCKTP